MNRGIRCCLFLVVAMLLLFLMNLLSGSVDIPFSEVFRILVGKMSSKASWRFIVLEARLPQALTAMLCGASLAVSGLLLQTAFRNPLAGPGIFGISSGASLGVAVVMLALGGSVSAGMFTFTGMMAVLLAAFAGAMLVTLVLFFFSVHVRNNVMLLIIGIMVGYLSNSAITLLNFFATEEGVRSYLVWGMGHFGGVPMSHMPVFASVSLVGIALSVVLVKPLNALLLGEQYAESMGVNTHRMRHVLLVVTGLLTAIATAFCGPVAFVGLAVPHIARLLVTTDNHRQLLPATLLCGSVVALFCNWVCSLPGEHGLLPLNAVTPLVGAPVIIYVLLTKH